MPLSTELPVGDLFEFIGDFRLNGDGPPTTGRMGLDRLQTILLGSTSLVGARIANIENRLATAESFTNQISSINTRLQAVEALGGIGNGTDLVGDGTAVRTTRYWGRPGEAIRTWTASIAATPAAAVPLAVGGAYSIVPTTMGPALRITGAASARPIAQIPLDDTQVEEFRATIKRGADDTTTPANNAPVFAFACFKADNTDNGTVPLPADPLTVAQGFKTYTFRASLVAGLGTVDLPANTRRVDLIPGGKGTGSIDVVSVERGSQPLTSAPLITTLGDGDFVATVSADRKSTGLIAFGVFKDLLMEKFIPQIADADIGSSPVVLIPADQNRNQVQIINVSASDALLIGFGTVPSEGQKNTFLLPPGKGFEQRYPRKDAIYAVAKTGSVSVFANYCNTSGVDVVANSIVEAYLARSAATPTAGEKSALTTLFNRFRASGAYTRFRTAAILKNFHSSIAVQDLIRDVTWTQVGSPVFTARQGFKGDGTGAYLNTKYRPRDDVGHFDIASHSFGAYVDDALQDSGKSVMGSLSTGLAPNRSATTTGARSGSPSTDLITVAKRGGMFGVSRTATTGYRFLADKAFQDIVRASDTFGNTSYDLLVLAQNSSTVGPTNFSTLTPAFVWAGEPMTDAMMLSIGSAVEEYSNTLNALAPGA